MNFLAQVSLCDRPPWSLKSDNAWGSEREVCEKCYKCKWIVIKVGG